MFKLYMYACVCVCVCIYIYILYMWYPPPMYPRLSSSQLWEGVGTWDALVPTPSSLQNGGSWARGECPFEYGPLWFQAVYCYYYECQHSY